MHAFRNGWLNTDRNHQNVAALCTVGCMALSSSIIYEATVTKSRSQEIQVLFKESYKINMMMYLNLCHFVIMQPYLLIFPLMFFLNNSSVILNIANK